MTWRAPTTVRNGYGDFITDLINAGAGAGVIQFRTGTQPNPDDAATGTLLATVTLIDPAFGAWAAGSASLTNPASVNGVATGTATWCRILDSSSVVVMDGTVTATGAGGDVELSTTSIVSGQAVDITGGTLTAGMA